MSSILQLSIEERSTPRRGLCNEKIFYAEEKNCQHIESRQLISGTVLHV